jgi:hypothetical protein
MLGFREGKMKYFVICLAILLPAWGCGDDDDDGNGSDTEIGPVHRQNLWYRR